MFKDNRIIAVIPARKGSKRLPNKNIRQLCGKPLIAHTIGQAKKSRYIDDILVSTDDRHIAEIAKKHGAPVPFLRPSRLASDGAKTVDVLLHAIRWCEGIGRVYDVIVLLQPTSPLRITEDIDGAIELLFKKKAAAIVSVCKTEHHPSWIGTLSEAGSMKGFMIKGRRNERCRMPSAFYKLNGAVFVVHSEVLKKAKSFYGKGTFAYIMPVERSVDIDGELDFQFAEYLTKKKT